MQPSATLAMTARANQKKSQGHPVIGLSAGEPDFDTPAFIAEAAERAIREGFTHYTNNKGLPALREAIRDKLAQQNGIHVGADDIVCSNGAKQSVAMAISVLCGPGDEVLIPAPYWVSYPEMARFAGATPVSVSTTVDSGYRLTAEQLEEAITPRTKLLILCSPSNPTGGTYTPEQMDALAAVLRRHPQVWVLSDEIYEHIRYEVPHVSIGSLEGMADRTVTVNGFSKAYAMTGWRLGYLAAIPEVAAAVSKLQSQLTSAPSSISQKAGLAALEMPHSVVQEMVAAFQARRDYVLARLAALDGVQCPRPDGAFYVFPSVKACYGRKAGDGTVVDSAETLCFHLLDAHNLALVPGHAFGDPDGLRISYAASMANLEEAMDRFETALGALH
ncbi:MAG: pyridoxal phosphate-dependent aminotransferase [Rhodothermales bacterium]|nr:pyridoxal phosphate-dependent aminotransferase [Rhodothermales bacterium]